MRPQKVFKKPLRNHQTLATVGHPDNTILVGKGNGSCDTVHEVCGLFWVAYTILSNMFHDSLIVISAFLGIYGSFCLVARALCTSPKRTNVPIISSCCMHQSKPRVATTTTEPFP